MSYGWALSAQHDCELNKYADHRTMRRAGELDVVSVCSCHVQRAEHVIAATAFRFCNWQ